MFVCVDPWVVAAGPQVACFDTDKRLYSILDMHICRYAAESRKHIMAKKKATKTKTGKVRRTRIVRPYPMKTLEEALGVAALIRDKNKGQPWYTTDLAGELGYQSLGSNTFVYLVSSARDYGLTVGTNNTEKIELTDFGRNLIYANDPATEKKLKIEAFFKVELFTRVFNYYGGCDFPEQKYVSNVLTKEFAIPEEIHTEFLSIYTKNCNFLGIAKGLGDVDVDVISETSSDDIRVVGEAKGKFGRVAFVIMPFTEKGMVTRPPSFFDQVLKSLITPAANAAGFAVETADRRGSDVIQSTIINKLLTADLVIADLTDHNPNVFFELGVRLAKELPVALIKTKDTGPTFDVDNLLRVEPYNQCPTYVTVDVNPGLRCSAKSRVTAPALVGQPFCSREAITVLLQAPGLASTAWQKRQDGSPGTGTTQLSF